jgi:PDZ domain-containing secreted protein
VLGELGEEFRLTGSREVVKWPMAREKPGQTLQATTLVNGAYVRLVDGEKHQHGNSWGRMAGQPVDGTSMLKVSDNTRDKKQGELIEWTISIEPQTAQMMALMSFDDPAEEEEDPLADPILADLALMTME